MNRFIDLIRKKLNIESITKKTLVHFDGPQNQGSYRIWFAIYNKTYSSQKHAFQLFFKIDEAGFEYGLLHMDKPTQKQLVSKEKIVWKELIDEYNKHIETIIGDNSKTNAMINNLIDLLTTKGQIILQGPPGTGKTYTAKDIAEKMIFKEISSDKKIQKANLESSEQFKLIQFHPSYSYEDFVRGITAQNNEGQIEYKTVNKVLAQFASEANRNYSNFNKEGKILFVEKWIKDKLADYIIELEQRYVGGKIYLNNTKAYIKKIEEDSFTYYHDNYYDAKNSGFKISYERLFNLILDVIDKKDIKSSNIFKKEITHKIVIEPLINDFKKFLGEIPNTSIDKKSLNNYILIIDEINRANLPAVLGELIYALEYRDEKVESMYELDGDRTIVLPKNLFIIGTMNTADRSVGHIDYAIRRRFAFVDLYPDSSIITLPLAKELFGDIDELFTKYTASDFVKNHVMLGHSYFLAENEEELRFKLKYEVIPILKEYFNDGIINRTQDSLELLTNITNKIEQLSE